MAEIDPGLRRDDKEEKASSLRMPTGIFLDKIFGEADPSDSARQGGRSEDG
jgi:hypothetical protein